MGIGAGCAMSEPTVADASESLRLDDEEGVLISTLLEDRAGAKKLGKTLVGGAGGA